MKRIATALGLSALPGVSLALLPSLAAAHPGHLTGGDVGILHFVTDPFHLVVSGAGVLLIVALRRGLRARRTAARSRI